MIKNKLHFLFIFLFILLIFDLDFREYRPGMSDISDDASYYFHAETIAKDFDLNYDNQIEYNSGFYKNRNNVVPKHPIGPAVFSSPFLYLGLTVEKINNLIPFSNNSNLSYLIYSLAPIFYFFLTILILGKISIMYIPSSSFSNFSIFLLLFGSGIGYFAFERHSMSHVYEVFLNSLILLLSFKIIKKNNAGYFYLLGFFSIGSIFIRWTNIYSLFIPLLVLLINEAAIKTLLKNKYFYFGILTATLLFLYHTYVLYEIISINPYEIYKQGSSATSNEYLLEKVGVESFFSISFLNILISSFVKILFGQEFGLLYFSPVIFSTFYILLFKVRKLNLLALITLIIFIPLVVTLLWQSTGSSYGFRYLYSIFPICFILCEKFLNITEKKILYSINIFSVYSLIVFETSKKTILREQINIFGYQHNYSARNYLSGVLESIYSIDTLVFAFATSLLIFSFLKFIILFDQISNLSNFVSNNFGYNSDYIDLVEFVQKVSFIEISILIFFIIFLINISKINNLSMFR